MATLHFPASHRSIIDPYLPPHSNVAGAPSLHQQQQQSPILDRPFVTLTYAQSLDSQIALGPGQLTVLSGPSSKAMTHFLRSAHDAILVGSGTAIADDPSLNCRLDDVVERTRSGNEHYLSAQPQPVVLDRRGRWDVSGSSKVVRLAVEGRGRGPWLLVGNDAYSSSIPDEKKTSIVDAGGEVLVVDDDAGSGSGFAEVLRVLASKGIRSVMVEGGATIINQLLSEHASLVDSVIVTIAPVLLGQGGVNVCPPRDDPSKAAVRLKDVQYLPLDQDVVMLSRIQRESDPS